MKYSGDIHLSVYPPGIITFEVAELGRGTWVDKITEFLSQRNLPQTLWVAITKPCGLSALNNTHIFSQFGG